MFISSELPEILGLSDRIYVMQNGRIAGELPGAGATEEAVLGLAMAEHLSHSVAAQKQLASEEGLAEPAKPESPGPGKP
jgi:ABC-type proline/glycine betaine transport system ATPase subunit